MDEHVAKQVLQYMRERVDGALDPRLLGKALVGDLAGLWRYRIGDHRALCELQDKQLTVFVLEVAHRREVCK